jgi:tetratricopeptide (TPR) repeat protein
MVMAQSTETEQGTPSPWLEWMEKATIASAVGGTLISALTQQVLFVSVPLSLAAVLNFADRQRMKSSMASMAATAEAKAELIATDANTMNQIQVIQLNRTHHFAAEGITALQIEVKALKEQSDVIVRKQEELIGSTFEESYYRRGLEYENKGEYKAAVSAYSEALRLNPNYATSYMQRGLAYANLDQKQQAIADLRTATKMFFESGDLENYHKARILSEEVHSGQPVTVAAPQEPMKERIAVDELFA